MSQTSYSLDHTAMSPGQLRYSQDAISQNSLEVESAAGIAMGIACSYGSAANGCIVGGSDFAGVTFRGSKPGAATTNATTNAQKSIADVLEIGRVAVTVSGTVAAGDAVAYVIATGLLTAGPATTGEINIVGARFESGASDGGTAWLKLLSQTTTAAA